LVRANFVSFLHIRKQSNLHIVITHTLLCWSIQNLFIELFVLEWHKIPHFCKEQASNFPTCVIFFSVQGFWKLRSGRRVVTDSLIPNILLIYMQLNVACHSLLHLPKIIKFPSSLLHLIKQFSSIDWPILKDRVVFLGSSLYQNTWDKMKV
jgi:hypothetical protein